MIYILSILGTVILFILVLIASRLPAMRLRSKFSKLGILAGKTYSQIVSKVGKPNSISFAKDEEQKLISVRQWIAPSYHIILLFDENDICLGVSKETQV